MRLSEFQEEIFSYLKDPGRDSDNYAFVLESKGIDRRTRLHSYRSSHKNRLKSCIKKDFKVSLKFLDLDDIDQFLEGYLAEHPSRTHYINEVSRYFPNYISENALSDSPEFLGELAMFEWLTVESFYNFFDIFRPAPDRKVEPTSFHVNSALNLLISKWPLHQIWLDEESYPQDTSFISIWTNEDRISRGMAWSEVEYEVLKAMQSSVSLEEAINRIPDNLAENEVEIVLRETLPEWVRLGIVQI